MTLDVLAQGRLQADPVRRETKAGRPYATARLSTTDADGQSHLVSLIAFNDDVVRQLLALGADDSVAVAGELGIGTYTAKTGETRPALRLLVHAVLTPYAVRRRREAANAERPSREHADRQRRHSAALRAQQPLPNDGLDDLPL